MSGFFKILIWLIAFTENEDGYDIMDNAVGLVNGDYHAMGAMLASMLLQGGPVLPVFNHHFLKYGNLGIEAATLETVCDTRYRDMITKVCISYSQFLASFSICLSVCNYSHFRLLKKFVWHMQRCEFIQDRRSLLTWTCIAPSGLTK